MLSGLELVGMLIGSLIMGGAIVLHFSEPKKK